MALMICRGYLSGLMKTSGITAALPAQDLGRAKAFYLSLSPWPIGVPAMGYRQDSDGVLSVIDGVQGAVVAAPGGPDIVKGCFKRFAQPGPLSATGPVRCSWRGGRGR